VNTSRQRLSARDYKNGGRRDGFDIKRYRQFAAGLAMGLLVALAVFLFDHRTTSAAPAVPRKHGDGKEIAPQIPAAQPEAPAEQFDFYKVLPESGVIVPGQQSGAKKGKPH
jgi:hypothetical protein